MARFRGNLRKHARVLACLMLVGLFGGAKGCGISANNKDSAALHPLQPHSIPFFMPYLVFDYSPATNLRTLPIRVMPSNYPVTFRDLVHVRIYADSATCASANQVGAFSMSQLINGAALNYSNWPAVPASMGLYFQAQATVNGRFYSTGGCTHIGSFTYDVTAPTLPRVLAPAAVNTATAQVVFSDIPEDAREISLYTSAACTTRTLGTPSIQLGLEHLQLRHGTQIITGESRDGGLVESGNSEVRLAGGGSNRNLGVELGGNPGGSLIDNPPSQTPNAPENGSLSMTVALPLLGSNTIHYGISDALGNTRCGSFAIIRDETAPVLSNLRMLPAARSSSTTPSIRADTLDGDISEVNVYLPSQTESCGVLRGSGTSEMLQGSGVPAVLPSPLPAEQIFHFHVRARDIAGNASECFPIPYHYDRRAPQLLLQVPRFVNESRVRITALASDVDPDLLTIEFYSPDGARLLAQGSREQLVSSAGITINGLQHGVENFFRYVAKDGSGNQTPPTAMPGVIALVETLKPLQFTQTPASPSTAAEFVVKAKHTNLYESALKFFTDERCSAHAGDAQKSDGGWSATLQHPGFGALSYYTLLFDMAGNQSDCFHAFDHVRLSSEESSAKLVGEVRFDPEFPARVKDVSVSGQTNEETAKIYFSLDSACRESLLILTAEEFGKTGETEASPQGSGTIVEPVATNLLHFPSEGTPMVYFKLEDIHGRFTGCKELVRATIDLSAPTTPADFTVERFTNQKTRGARLTFNKQAQDNLTPAHYQARLEGSGGEPVGTQNFVDVVGLSHQPQAALEEGKSYRYAVRAVDAAGNVSASVATETFTVDTQTTLSVSSPAQGAEIEGSKAIVKLRCEAKAQVAVVSRIPEGLQINGALLCDDAGEISLDVPRGALDSAEVKIQFTSTDLAGNIAHADAVFSFAETLAPAATIKIVSPEELANEDGKTLLVEGNQLMIKGACENIAGDMNVFLGPDLYAAGEDSGKSDEELIRRAVELLAGEAAIDKLACVDGEFSFAVGFIKEKIEETDVRIVGRNSDGVATELQRKFGIEKRQVAPEAQLKITSPSHGSLVKPSGQTISVKGTCSGLAKPIHLVAAGEANMIDSEVPCASGQFTARVKLTKQTGLASVEARSEDAQGKSVVAYVGFGYEIELKATQPGIDTADADTEIDSTADIALDADARR